MIASVLLTLALGSAAQAPAEVVAQIQVHGNVLTTEDEVIRLAEVSVGMAFESATIEAVTSRLQATRHRCVALAAGCDGDSARLGAVVDERHEQVLRRQFGRGALGPLDDEHTVGGQFIEGEFGDLRGIFEAVEVGVIEARAVAGVRLVDRDAKRRVPEPLEVREDAVAVEAVLEPRLRVVAEQEAPPGGARDWMQERRRKGEDCCI